MKTASNFILADFFMQRSCKIEDIYYNYKYCKNKNLIVYKESDHENETGFSGDSMKEYRSSLA